MKKSGIILGLALGLLSASYGQNYLSPCALEWKPDGRTLYVTAATGKQVLLFDTTSGTSTRTFSLPCDVTATKASADGKQLFVTGGGPAGTVFVLDAATGSVKQKIPVGHTPMAPMLSPDGKILYVCNRFDNDISFIDLQTGKTTARVPVLREPVAADISPDGKTLYVANHIPDGRADADYVASKISRHQHSNPRG